MVAREVSILAQSRARLDESDEQAVVHLVDTLGHWKIDKLVGC